MTKTKTNSVKITNTAFNTVFNAILENYFGFLGSSISLLECECFQFKDQIIAITEDRKIMFRHFGSKSKAVAQSLTDQPRAEYIWKLETNQPEKSFQLTPKAIETQAGLVFFEVENYDFGVYFDSTALYRLAQTVAFDSLKIQSSDGYLLFLKENIVRAICQPVFEMNGYAPTKLVLQQGSWSEIPPIV